MFSPNKRKYIGFLAFALFASFSVVSACPFCSAVSQTFSEEMLATDVVVIAKLISKPKDLEDREKLTEAELAEAEAGRSQFEILEIIKGKEVLTVGMKFKTVFFGDAAIGNKFLVMGVEPPGVLWSTPLKVDDETIKYVKSIPSLPKEGVDRLKFFQSFLESEIEVLARDSYDEFAKAPYKDIIDLKPHMDHDRLIEWVKDPDITASRKRLYYTMLGVCGTDEDCELFESMMKSEDRLKKAGLDALIASYLTLKGNDGLPFIEENFLANKKSDYSDTYQAISALRFHGSESDVLKKERMVTSLRLLLKRPRLADLVIPDLARWEDWTAMEELVELFKNSTKETSWVRVPVINYLRACPLEKADLYIAELKEIDPASVKRAMTFFPIMDDEEEDDEDVAQESGADPAESKGAESKATEKVEALKVGTEPIKEPKNSTEPAKESTSPILEDPDKLNPELIEQASVIDPPCTAEVLDSQAIEQASAVSTTIVTDENQMQFSSVMNTDLSQQQVSTVAANDQPNRQGPSSIENDSPVVAEIPFQISALIVAVPVVSCLLLFVFLWLVISGRVDRIWV